MIDNVTHDIREALTPATWDYSNDYCYYYYHYWYYYYYYYHYYCSYGMSKRFARTVSHSIV